LFRNVAQKLISTRCCCYGKGIMLSRQLAGAVVQAACSCSYARRGFIGTSSHLPSVALHPRFRQFRSPAKPDPLLDVISKTGPESFHSYLEQPAEVELPEPRLFLDPGMGKFGDGASLFIDFLHLFRFHLLRKKDDCWIRHAPHD
jgi:hypothetical protein